MWYGGSTAFQYRAVVSSRHISTMRYPPALHATPTRFRISLRSRSKSVHVHIGHPLLWSCNGRRCLLRRRPHSTFPRGLHAPQHQSRDGHHEERNAGNIEQCFLETEEIELVDLHDEEVKLSPAAFVFQNFARLPVYNDVGSIVIVEPYTHGVLSMVFFSRGVLFR